MGGQSRAAAPLRGLCWELCEHAGMALVMSRGKMSASICIGRERMMTWRASLCGESAMLSCGFALRVALGWEGGRQNLGCVRWGWRHYRNDLLCGILDAPSYDHRCCRNVDARRVGVDCKRGRCSEALIMCV